MTSSDLVQVATRIERDLHRRLAEQADHADRSVAAEMRQAIRAWVDEDRESSETGAAA